MTLPRYVLLDKRVGETPLECAENWRTTNGIQKHIPLAYAGRLDPMASGKLLVLVGEECKHQKEYHGLDKEYEFSVLLGIGSDTGDVLGVVTESKTKPLPTTNWKHIATSLTGTISLPFPHYSARTVKGKPLHTWAVEGRLHEITIPVQRSTVYHLTVHRSEVFTRSAVVEKALEKIKLLPTVTDPRKALGNDFRRPAVYAAWEQIQQNGAPGDQFLVIHFRCIASSGTYMRSLAEEIGKRAGSTGLAFSIHRTTIGRYLPLYGRLGFWRTRFRQ